MLTQRHIHTRTSLTLTRVPAKVPLVHQSSGEGAFRMWVALRMCPKILRRSYKKSDDFCADGSGAQGPPQFEKDAVRMWAEILAASHPDPSNPCFFFFFRFPCFFWFPVSLAFWAFFLSSPRVFGGSTKRKTLALFGVSLFFFSQESKGWRVRAIRELPRDLLREYHCHHKHYRPEKILSELFPAILDRIITGKYSKRAQSTRTAKFDPTSGSTSVPTSGPTKAPTRAPTMVPTRVPTNAHFPVSALRTLPTKGPTKRPTRVFTEVPTKVPTKTVSFHMSCFHMFCSLPKYSKRINLIVIRAHYRNHLAVHRSHDTRTEIPWTKSCSELPDENSPTINSVIFDTDFSSRTWRNLPPTWAIHMETRRLAHNTPIHMDFLYGSL